MELAAVVGGDSAFQPPGEHVEQHGERHCVRAGATVSPRRANSSESARPSPSGAPTVPRSLRVCRPQVANVKGSELGAYESPGVPTSVLLVEARLSRVIANRLAASVGSCPRQPARALLVRYSTASSDQAVTYRRPGARRWAPCPTAYASPSHAANSSSSSSGAATRKRCTNRRFVYGLDRWIRASTTRRWRSRYPVRDACLGVTPANPRRLPLSVIADFATE